MSRILLLAALLLAAPARADLDQARRHGVFGITACALVAQAVQDARMTRDWYVAAAHLLHQCERTRVARIAERKGGVR